MLSFVADGIQAYDQIGFLLAALVCLGLGGLVLGNALYWRIHAVWVSGTILGVIDNNGTYAPVYRYTLANGQTHEAKSDTSSSAVEGKETGRIVPLLISAHNPSSAREANGYLLEIIGIILIAPGLLFGTIAVTSHPVTPMTWLIGAAILVYLAYRGWRVFIPKNARPSLDEWRRQRGLDAAIDLTQVRPIESIASAGAARQRDQAEGQRARKWAPVIGIFAVVLAAAAIYQSITLAHLESAGVRAPGRIVRLKEEWGSGSSGSRYTYYPIVRFHTHDNLAVEFKDNIGSNPIAAARKTGRCIMDLVSKGKNECA